jgi:hypothetical protein
MAQPRLPLRRADPSSEVTAARLWPPHTAGRPRDRAPRLVAAMALVAGLINLLSALLPAEWIPMRVLEEFVPGAISRGATIGTAAAGVGLLLLAGGLRRRQRLAWLAAVGLLVASAVLHVVRGLDVEEALAKAFLGGLLAGKGAQFRARPGERGGLLLPALAVVAVTVGYGVVGLLVNNREVVEDLSVTTTLREVARMAIGAGTSLTLLGGFGRFFPASVAAVFLFGALVVVTRALAPALVPRVSTRPGGGGLGGLAGLLCPPRRPSHRAGRRNASLIPAGRNGHARRRGAAWAVLHLVTWQRAEAATTDLHQIATASSSNATARRRLTGSSTAT